MSQDEQVDVVDEVNNVLYQTSKFEAHKKGLLHRTVIAGIKTSDGKRLLVKQTSHKQDAGQYVSPVGGHVTSGETEDEALKREAKEEVGIENFKYKLIGKKIYQRKVLNRNENHYFIYYEIIWDGKIQFNDEIERVDYFQKAELEEEIKSNPEKFGAAYKFIYENFYD